LQERRRVGPQVDAHVEDRSGEAAHQLHLLVSRVLEVHAANRPHAGRVGDTVLWKFRFETVLAESVDAQFSRKKAGLILHWVRTDEPRTIKADCFEPPD